jgi:predicted HTH transcriptional regulator
LQLAPNIYGIIFGTKHPLAIQKYLDIAWKKAPENGQANYDIHNDAEALQGDFFIPALVTREEQFKLNLWNFLSEKGQCTNKDILEFVFEDGFSRKKAKKMLASWKKEGKIRYSGQAGLSYNACYKEGKKRIIHFEIIQ